MAARLCANKIAARVRPKPPSCRLSFLRGWKERVIMFLELLRF
ncbi:hypothetical protein HMPREF0201_01959 [Cedecea davisae DSM 4568]|uniref:Uncharacterized protein n=1 Tax=Cedecea davisae DSM 4568 TaxID=566551 RepID=S3JBT1_9ENTR|nr:hypothetical protein HMPREF0201_01959 [Cedecea davisae DSM 4568]